MKTLYIECHMGAAGDMLTAALLELHGDPQGFLRRLNGAGIPGVTVTAEPSVKCGVRGTHIKVTVGGLEEGDHDHDHSHSSLCGVTHIIGHLNVSDRVKQDAAAVYRLIAEAESHVHGVPVTDIHFHEVGALDAVADIVGMCMLMEELAPETVLASPVNVGSGHVRCAHGVLPVPAPATAYLLQNIPMYNDQIKGELCTPTGAALLRHFAERFCGMPVMTVEKIGYGMGKKDFERANCVRVFIGRTEDAQDEVAELICNLDDMTPEAVAFAQQLLFEAGALDVYTTPIGMKKGRMGVSLTCMCAGRDSEKFISLIFKHTTTLGMRENICRRHTLRREESSVRTAYGDVRVKTAHGFGVTKSKPEYEDVAKIARDTQKSLQEIIQEIE